VASTESRRRFTLWRACVGRSLHPLPSRVGDGLVSASWAAAAGPSLPLLLRRAGRCDAAQPQLHVSLTTHRSALCCPRSSPRYPMSCSPAFVGARRQARRRSDLAPPTHCAGHQAKLCQIPAARCCPRACICVCVYVWTCTWGRNLVGYRMLSFMW
jgi:hypothetical protein